MADIISRMTLLQVQHVGYYSLLEKMKCMANGRDFEKMFCSRKYALSNSVIMFPISVVVSMVTSKRHYFQSIHYIMTVMRWLVLWHVKPYWIIKCQSLIFSQAIIWFHVFLSNSHNFFKQIDLTHIWDPNRYYHCGS